MSGESNAGNDAASASVLINGLKHVSYLLFFDIALLTHLRDEGGRDYLDFWCDDIEGTDRRLVFRVTPEDLDLYLTRRKSLRDVILNPADGFYYMVDGFLGVPVTDDKISLAYPSGIDEDYIPSPDSFHDPRDVR